MEDDKPGKSNLGQCLGLAPAGDIARLRAIVVSNVNHLYPFLYFILRTKVKVLPNYYDNIQGRTVTDRCSAITS